MTSDEARNDRAVEKRDAQVEAANQECPTCGGTGSVRAGWQDDDGDICPDCDGEGVAW